MKNSKHIFILIFCLIMLLSSCATTLNVKVTRPAELDLNGAQTIAVLPIKPYEYYEIREAARGVEVFVGVFFELFDRVGPEEKRCIDKLQYEIERGLMDSPYIDLVSATAVSNAIKNNTSNPADVYLTGEITRFDIFDNKNERRIKVKDGDKETGEKPEYKKIVEFSRSIRLNFRYQIVDSVTGKIISFDRVELYANSGYKEDPRDLPSGYSMIEYDLSTTARKILRELQPYVVIKSITLMEDKTKNPDFKAADKLAKDGYLKDAYEKFSSIYQDIDMIEAGYNAAMLQMALGNLSEAERQMSDLYNKHPSTKTLSGLNDIKDEIAQAKKLKSQTEFSDVLDVDF